MPGGWLQHRARVPTVGRSVRRGRILRRVGRFVPGGRLRRGLDGVHRHRERRRVRRRRGRSLQRRRQHVRRCLQGQHQRLPPGHGSMRRSRKLHGRRKRLPGGCVRPRHGELHGQLARRRVRRRPSRSLLRHRRHVRRCLSIFGLRVSSLGGSMRRRRDLHRIVGRVPGRRVRDGGNALHGYRQRRRVRRRPGRPLLRNRQLLRRRLSGGRLRMPRVRGAVRRRGNLHRIVEQLPGGRVRARDDSVHRQHPGRRVRQRRGRSLHGNRQQLCRRLSGGRLRVPPVRGPVRRRRDVRRLVEHLPGRRRRHLGHELRGDRQRRRVRQRRGRPLHRDQQQLCGRL